MLVQTCTPDHPAIAAAARHDEAAFLETELAERKDAGYPPFCRLVSLRFSGESESDVQAAAEATADAIRASAEAADVELLGPAPQPLARLRGQYRWHVLLKGAHSEALHDTARAALAAHEAAGWSKAVRIAADVDPVDVL